MSNSSDLPPDRNPVTTVDLIAVAAGDGDKALITRVHDAARASTLVAGQLAMFSRIVDAMRGDNLNEPSINALVAAKALGAQLHARRARADHRDRVVLPTFVETLFDRAAAIVLDWLRPDGTPAFAGLRDDRGADLLEVSADAAGFVIRCERTPAMEGITRLVAPYLGREPGAVGGIHVRWVADNEVDPAGIPLEYLGHQLGCRPASGDEPIPPGFGRGPAREHPVPVRPL